ncbi:MAG: hypothetical protein AB7P24_03185 [Nitrospira sp.]
MLIISASRAVTVLSLSLLTSLTDCTFLAFSDSSAMRIEVEVYKGPLSLEPETQLGELYGYLIEAHNGLGKTYDFIEETRTNHHCTGALDSSKSSTGAPDSIRPSSEIHESYSFNCSILDAIAEDALSYQKRLTIPICLLNPSAEAVGTATCKEVLSLSKAGDDNQSKSKELREGQRKFNKKLSSQQLNLFNETPEKKIERKSDESYFKYRQAFIETGRIATVMQAGAFRYATASSAGQSINSDVRISLVYLSIASSEYGNQLEARADTLLKQLGTYGRDRRELPLSAHLRESEPTDFLHLFDWMDGHTPRIIDYLTFNISPNIEERIKIVERLYGDHFWSKINTVYASGRGKTQMAFIKDETGNWNLKSFDNDPTELLEVYTDVAKAALKNAANIAAGAATGGGSSASLLLAKQLRDFATESEPDKAISQTPTIGTLSLEHLRIRLMNKLDPVQFKDDLDEEEQLLKVLNGKDPDAAKTAQANLFKHRQQVITRWEAILNDHSNLVDILSSTVKKK